MTTTVTETNPALDPATLGGWVTHYGVTLADIGVEGWGEIVALGHVEARRLVAAVGRHDRRDLGMDWHERGWPLLDDTLEAVRPGHAVFTRHGWDCPQADPGSHVEAERDECGCDPDMAWHVEPAADDTPGAVPVTWWEP